MKHTLQIIGLYPGSLEPPEHTRSTIHQADILTGGKRLLDTFPDFKGRKIKFISPVSEYATEIKRHMEAEKRVVLLADGDPSFFGIAESLSRYFNSDDLEITPSPTTLQIAAARLGISWKNFQTISLHGRDDFFPLYSQLQQNHNCAIYTDQTNTPARISAELTMRGINSHSMHVLAELGTGSEVVQSGNIADFTDSRFADLNIVLLTTNNQDNQNRRFGREDDSFIRQKGLITKLPVRATGLALLDLRAGQTVWDLGAGCGSVAIEGSFLCNDSRFYAVEKDEKRFEMIEQNIRNLKAWTVTPVAGTMPEALTALPDPDRIFMGGGIGRDDSVVKEAARRLKSGGRLVIHAILMGSIQRTRETFESLGWEWQAMQLQASTSDKLAGDVRFKAQNPVTIMWADKPEG